MNGKHLLFALGALSSFGVATCFPISAGSVRSGARAPAENELNSRLALPLGDSFLCENHQQNFLLLQNPWLLPFGIV